MLRKVKKYVECNNSGQYLFSPTTPNKEIPHIFNLIMPKEDLMYIFIRIRYFQRINT